MHDKNSNITLKILCCFQRRKKKKKKKNAYIKWVPKHLELLLAKKEKFFDK